MFEYFLVVKEISKKYDMAKLKANENLLSAITFYAVVFAIFVVKCTQSVYEITGIKCNGQTATQLSFKK